MKAWLQCACEQSVVWRATKYAFFVGIILILINHVDHIFQGEVTAATLIKMGLTVLVPYMVSTCSSVGAILRMQATERNQAR